MKSYFTLNDLILYTFCETEKQEDIGLFNSINSVEKRKRDFQSLRVSPNRRILNNIFSYARALSVLKTEKAGNFNLLMN